MALSSMLPLSAVLMLSRRPRKELKGEVAPGEPDRPSVVTDRRRCWAWAAAVVMGPGTCWVGGELPPVPAEVRWADERLVPNRSANVWPAKDERRWRDGEGAEVGSSAIVSCVGGECGVCFERLKRDECAAEAGARPTTALWNASELCLGSLFHRRARLKRKELTQRWRRSTP